MAGKSGLRAVNPTKRLVDGMPYTNAASTTPNYLRDKFERIRKEMEAEKRAKDAKVKPIRQGAK